MWRNKSLSYTGKGEICVGKGNRKENKQMHVYNIKQIVHMYHMQNTIIGHIIHAIDMYPRCSDIIYTTVYTYAFISIIVCLIMRLSEKSVDMCSCSLQSVGKDFFLISVHSMIILTIQLRPYSVMSFVSHQIINLLLTLWMVASLL